MNTLRPDSPTLRDLIAQHPGLLLDSVDGSISGREVLEALTSRRNAFAGSSVILAPKSQLAAAVSMIALDGVAARLVVCPPDLGGDRLAQIEALSHAEVKVSGESLTSTLDFDIDTRSQSAANGELRHGPTQWVLPTSGTTGAPKLVSHRLTGLLGAISPALQSGPMPVWATFYDIRRFGGLQIFLRACATGAHFVISDAAESLTEFLARCRAAKVTHFTGTPSHWRRLLMSPDSQAIDPRYVRLSGEIADQAILDGLSRAYPKARVVHAYASTEAGVGFEVSDRLEGFPTQFLGRAGKVELHMREGVLKVRSARTADCYIGRDDLQLQDPDGFVDTGDLVEIRGDRCFFKGRRAGIVNVGGLKVHPEEVERVLNTHEDIRMSRVFARRNPVVGDLIAAEVVLTPTGETRSAGAVREELLALCRARLARHETPASIRIVPHISVSPSGKLARSHA
jgi:acyl-coenzyme A synthetase/AMP-(fatty) acid ligase